eukprot:m.9624 g.9624  ORF g.9624 m.9624 type:complete len:245 (+) comp5475_c0_seq1:165-899(+)
MDRASGRIQRPGKGNGAGKAGRGNKKPKQKSLAARIRDVERMLKRDLPATIRVAQERKLESLKTEVSDKQRVELEKQYAQRYKKVKFLERRKLQRIVDRVDKLAEPTAEDNAQKTDALVKITYIRTFPPAERYISVLKPDSELKDDAREQRATLLEAAKTTLKDEQAKAGAKKNKPAKKTTQIKKSSGTAASDVAEQQTAQQKQKPTLDAAAASHMSSSSDSSDSSNRSSGSDSSDSSNSSDSD